MTLAPRILLRYATETEGGRAAAAAAVAGAISRLLLEPPGEALIAELAEALEPSRQWDELSTAASRLAHALVAVDLDVCRKEYARLFVGPNPAPCIPFESVWTDVPPLLMGRSHHDALRFFRRAGFQPRSSSDPADHIGIELGFVALLASRIAAGSGDGPLLEEFWARHVERWIPAFGERLAREARAPLYRTVGEIIGDVTQWTGSDVRAVAGASAATTEG